MASVTRASLLLASLPSFGLGVLLATEPHAAKRPHVLFVVIDDWGWADVGFRSQEIKTPTIDALAKEGVVFDQYYTEAVCSPSRATFMTGRYAMHTGIVDWIPPKSPYGLPLSETTMAEKFKEVGYATHAVGKWHLGFYRKESTPTFRGFDSFFGFYGGGEDHYKHTWENKYDFRRDPSPRCGPGCSQIVSDVVGQYSTTLFSDEAVRIVRGHPADKPLFLYLAYQAVHSPAQVPREYEDAYRATIADPVRRKFAGMISCVDEGLANVTAALHARHMMDDTLVVVTTDNGGPIISGDAVGSSNWPLRGGKHSIWEGGTRGIALVAGKMLQRTGYTFTHLMHGADWLPTMASVAGYDVSKIRLPLDGVSQWDAINGGNSHPQKRTGFIYGNSTNECKWGQAVVHGRFIPCGFAMRRRQWKLMLGYGGGPDSWCNKTSKGLVCEASEVSLLKAPKLPRCLSTGLCLWDVVDDPGEHTELSDRHPDVVKELEAELHETLRSYHSYEVETACGRAVFEQDPTVGPTWAPWC